MNKWKHWLHSLFAALIGGAANAITAALVKPEDFNFGAGLRDLGLMAIGGAIISVAFFLQKSPLPDEGE